MQNVKELNKQEMQQINGSGGASGNWWGMDSKTKACVNGQVGGMLVGATTGLGGIIIGGIGGAIAGGCFN